MNPVLNRPRRITVLSACFALLVAMVMISAERADAAAPAPINFAISLTADPTTSECVAQLTWDEGHGQIYVQMVLFRDVGGTMELQSSHASKVSTAGDPRGSKAMTHTFVSPLLQGGGDGQVLDVTISTAKGKNGASGDPIGWVSMMGISTATCGQSG